MAQFRTQCGLRKDRRVVILQRELLRHFKLGAPREHFYCLADTEKTNEGTDAIKRPAIYKITAVVGKLGAGGSVVG